MKDYLKMFLKICFIVSILIINISCEKEARINETLKDCSLVMISPNSDSAVQVCRYEITYLKNGQYYEYEYWTHLYNNTNDGFKREKSILTTKLTEEWDMKSPIFSQKGGRFIAFILGETVYAYDITTDDLQEASIELSGRTAIEHDREKKLYGVKAVAFQPNGDILAINTTKGIAFFKRESNVWKELLQSGKIYKKIPFISEDDYIIKNARDIGFTPLGEYLVALDEAGVINFYTVNIDNDYVNVQCVKSTEGNHEAAYFVILSDAKTVVLISEYKQRVWIYDLWSGRSKGSTSLKESGIEDGGYFWNKNYGWFGGVDYKSRRAFFMRTEDDEPEFDIPETVDQIDYDFTNNKLIVWHENNPEYFQYLAEEAPAPAPAPLENNR